MLRPTNTALCQLGFALIALAGCQLPPRSSADADGLIEPDVFRVLRAANRQAVIDQLDSRRADQLRQAELLRLEIEGLEAAEEGLAFELEELRIELKYLRDERAELELELAKEAAALEQARTAVEAQKAAADAGGTEEGGG